MCHTDGSCERSGPIRGYALSWQLRRLFGAYSQFDGMLVLLDACSAGRAVIDAPNRWLQSLAEAQNRLTILSAVIDRPAVNGCFTQALTEILRDGLDKAGEYLTVDQLKPAISERCPTQQPPLLHTVDSSRQADPSLWLARNKAVRQWQLLANTPGTSLAEELTRWLQPTQPLIDIVAQSLLHRSVLIAGEAGCGKSTLVAALAEAQNASVENVVPTRFVDGLVFTQLAPSPHAIADLLARQLRKTVGGFCEAEENTGKSLPQRRSTARDISSSIGHRPAGATARRATSGTCEFESCSNGWSQLADEVQHALDPVLRILIGPELARVHLILTSRIELPLFDCTVLINPADEDDIKDYLNKRLKGREPSPQVRLAQGSWLIARLLADLASRPAVTSRKVNRTDWRMCMTLSWRGQFPLSAWGSAMGNAVCACRNHGWPGSPRYDCLRDSCKQLNGPGTLAQLRNLLVPLGGLVVGRPRHRTRTESACFMTRSSPTCAVRDCVPLILNSGHRALAEAIDNLAPAPSRNAQHYLDDPMQLYARRNHAEHLWALDQFDDALKVVDSRLGYYPADNRDTWRRWRQRLKPSVVRCDPGHTSCALPHCWLGGEGLGMRPRRCECWRRCFRTCYENLAPRIRALFVPDGNTLSGRGVRAGSRGH